MNIGLLLLKQTPLKKDIDKIMKEAKTEAEKEAQELTGFQAYSIGVYFLRSLSGRKAYLPEGVLQALVNKMVLKQEIGEEVSPHYYTQQHDNLLLQKDELVVAYATQLNSIFTPAGKKDVTGFFHDSYLIGVALAKSYPKKYKGIMEESMLGKSPAEAVKFSLEIMNALAQNKVELEQTVIHTQAPPQEVKVEANPFADFISVADTLVGSIKQTTPNDSKKTLYLSAEKIYLRAKDAVSDPALKEQLQQKILHVQTERGKIETVISQAGLGGFVQPARAQSDSVVVGPRRGNASSESSPTQDTNPKKSR